MRIYSFNLIRIYSFNLIRIYSFNLIRKNIHSIRKNIYLISGTGSSHRIWKARAWEWIIAIQYGGRGWKMTCWKRPAFVLNISLTKRNIFDEMMWAKELPRRMLKLSIRVSGCLDRLEIHCRDIPMILEQAVEVRSWINLLPLLRTCYHLFKSSHRNCTYQPRNCC